MNEKARVYATSDQTINRALYMTTKRVRSIAGADYIYVIWQTQTTGAHDGHRALQVTSYDCVTVIILFKLQFTISCAQIACAATHTHTHTGTAYI